MKNYIGSCKFVLINAFLLSSVNLFAQLDNSSMPPKRAHHALVFDDAKKQIVLFGGSTPVDGGNSAIFLNDAWTFDGMKWTYHGEAGDKRSGIGLAFDSKRKKIFSFGGYTGQTNCCSDLRVWENNDWKKVSEIPGLAAAEAGLVYDSQRDKLITFGGSPGQRQVNNDTWEWDGKEWKKFEGAHPEGRQAFVMVYDDKRKRTILFGGMGNSGPGSLSNDTWEFDGKQWEKISVEGPGARASSGFAYDSNKGELIVFGGMTKDGFVNDTWSYNGKEWKKLSSEGPQKRAMGYLAYDKKRKKVVMFGGRLGWPNDANDTWEWDGVSWKEIKN